MEENVYHLQMTQILIVTLALQTTLKIQKTQMTYIQASGKNIPPFTHKENTHTETHLVMHTYSTMTLTIKILLHLETNIQH